MKTPMAMRLRLEAGVLADIMEFYEKVRAPANTRNALINQVLTNFISLLVRDRGVVEIIDDKEALKVLEYGKLKGCVDNQEFLQELIKTSMEYKEAVMSPANKTKLAKTGRLDITGDEAKELVREAAQRQGLSVPSAD